MTSFKLFMAYKGSLMSSDEAIAKVLAKSGELGFFSWLKSIRGAQAHSIWAKDDPGPMMIVLWRMFSAALRKVTGRK